MKTKKCRVKGHYRSPVGKKHGRVHVKGHLRKK